MHCTPHPRPSKLESAYRFKTVGCPIVLGVSVSRADGMGVGVVGHQQPRFNE